MHQVALNNTTTKSGVVGRPTRQTAQPRLQQNSLCKLTNSTDQQQPYPIGLRLHQQQADSLYNQRRNDGPVDAWARTKSGQVIHLPGDVMVVHTKNGPITKLQPLVQTNSGPITITPPVSLANIGLNNKSILSPEATPTREAPVLGGEDRGRRTANETNRSSEKITSSQSTSAFHSPAEIRLVQVKNSSQVPLVHNEQISNKVNLFDPVKSVPKSSSPPPLPPPPKEEFLSSTSAKHRGKINMLVNNILINSKS